MAGARPPGRDCGRRAAPRRAGSAGEGVGSERERSRAAVRSPPELLAGASAWACEQEIKGSGRGFSRTNPLTNRGFVCLFSWWF